MFKNTTPVIKESYPASCDLSVSLDNYIWYSVYSSPISKGGSREQYLYNYSYEFLRFELY